MLSIDEAIEKNRKIAEMKKTIYDACILEEYNRHLLREYKENEQLAEWLEKLKTIENIMLTYNANWYTDEDNGVPDCEVLESIWNVIQDNGLDIDIQQDYRKGKADGYNKAVDDFAILIKETLNHDCATTKISEQIIYNRLFDKCNEIAEQLRECKVDESTD